MARQGSQLLSVPDGSITGVKLADDSVGNEALAIGTIIQSKYIDLNARQVITTVVPSDDTIPQITEGDEVFSLSITPKSTTNELLVEWNLMLAGSGVINIGVALFRDAGVNSIGSKALTPSVIAHTYGLGGSIKVTAGSIAPTSFSLRAGPNSGTCYVNGDNATRLLGDIPKSSFTITEIKA